MILSTFVDQSMNATHHLEKNHAPFTRSFHKAFILFETQTKMLRRHLLPNSHYQRERWLGGDLKNVSLIINKPPKGRKLSISAKRWLEECTIGLITKLLPWYIFNFNTRVCWVIILFFKFHFVNEKDNLYEISATNIGNFFFDMRIFERWYTCVETWE